MEITDSATELYRLLIKTKAVDSTAATVVVLFNDVFKLQAAELAPVRFSVINIISRRIEILEKQIRESKNIPDDLKDGALGHLGTIRAGFEPSALARQWNEVRPKYFRPDVLEGIRFVGSSLRKEFPLPRLSTEDIEFLKDKIQEILKDLGDSVVEAAIFDVLDGIIFVLDNYEYLGEKELVDRALEGFAYVQACRAKPAGSKDPVWKTAVVLYGVVSFFTDAAIYTDSLIEASGNWQQRLRTTIEYIAGEQPPEPVSLPSTRRALAPPVPRLAGPAEKARDDANEEDPDQ